ncbi:phage tail protein [Kribbella ginsengisoli]|uniref:Phage tail protein n=1 Tax=Kribbella ginsengisoli TaxID=363865 RepID=A0ABP6WMH0_9ACTN
MSVPGVSMVGGVLGTTETLIPRQPVTKQRGPAPGVTMWFNVWVSRLDHSMSLGTWSACSGLEVQLTPEGPFDEGGNYAVPHYLPGKVSYGKVTLERAMTYAGSRKVREWLEEQAAEWSAGRDSEVLKKSATTTVVVELHSGPGKKDQLIHSWKLTEAVAVGWTVPPFSTSGGGIAIEKLTLVHGGFLDGTERQPVKLSLVDKADESESLTFEYNPAKITLNRKRQVDTGRSTVDSSAPMVDPNAVAITLADLRLEGTETVKTSVKKLRKWIELRSDRSSSAGPTPPPATPGTRPVCEACKRLEPSPDSDTAPGSPVVLKLLWGAGGGGLPKEMLLKGFDLHFVRFTSAGVPSRATVTLTLEEYKGANTAGGGLSKGRSAPGRSR